MKENYCVFQTVICGADHLEKHELRRDYADCYENEKVKIIVAAGGRNDKPYIRSFIGASLAAKATLEAARIFAAGANEKKLLTNAKAREQMLRQLEGSIITRWQDAVKDHLSATPFLSEEIEGIGEDAAFEKYKKAYQEGKNTEYAYSASITAVIITENYTIALRNGNGDCIFVENTGKAGEPLPWNEKCKGAYCTSFCDRTAIQEFRHAFVAGKPKLAVVATDGLRKCFEDKEQLYKYLADFWKKIDWPSVSEQKEEIQFQPAQDNKIRDDIAIAAAGTDWSEAYGMEQEKNRQAETKKRLQEEKERKEKEKAVLQQEKKTEKPKKQPASRQKNNRLLFLIAAVAVVALAVKIFSGSGTKLDKVADTTTAYESTEPETSELEQSEEETTEEETIEEETTPEETIPEDTTPEETLPPEPQTEAPTQPPTTAAPPPTQPPTTASPPPTQPPTTASPPPTQPPTTAAPPPTQPPTTAPPPTTASPTLPGPAIIW